jgi:hypothetical protein
MNSWVEFDVEKKTARIIIPFRDGEISVEMKNSYFTVQQGEVEHSVRIGAESELEGIASASRTKSLTSINVSFKRLIIRGCDENWPSQALVAPVTCRVCEAIVIAAGLEPFLIPSLSWAFEDMRACEECQPFTPPCKSKRASFDNRIYISDVEILCRGVSPECPGCGASLGQRVTSSSPLYQDLGIDGRWSEISKSKVSSSELPFLAGYTNLAEAGKFVQQVVDDSRKLRMTLRSETGLETEVKVLSDPLHIFPLENEGSERPFRALKCLVRADAFAAVAKDDAEEAPHDAVEALIEAANRPQLPKELSPPGNTWTLMFLPLPPDLDE